MSISVNRSFKKEPNEDVLVIKKPRKSNTYKNAYSMAFVSDRDEQVSSATSCRDYMQDTLRAFFNNKKRLGCDGHTYYPELGDPDPSTEKMRIIIKVSSDWDDAEIKPMEKFQNCIKILNLLEEYAGIEKTAMRRVVVGDNTKRCCVLLEGSNEYLYNPHLLSLVTLVMRFTYYNKVNAVDEKSLYRSHLNSNKDKHIMADCHRIIHTVLKERKSIFDGLSTKELFPIDVGYSFHSQGGIQYLCLGKSSNKIVNGRIKEILARNE